MSIIKQTRIIIDFLQSPTVAMQLPGTVEASGPNPLFKKLCKWLQFHIYFLNYDKTLIQKNNEQGHRPSLLPVVFVKNRNHEVRSNRNHEVRSNVGQKLQLNFVYFLFLCALSVHNLQALVNDQFTIMIDPAGDAKHTGRLINDTLERGISLQCAEQLKAVLSQKFKNIRVILTRVPGETIQPLQNASFANRLGVDLYISLYFYHELQTPAYVALYHYLENPIADAWHKPTNLALYQVNQAHLLNLKTTQAWGKIILEVLQDKQCSKFFRPRGLFGIPFIPLVGIKAPAIAVEVGLKNKQDWQHIIDPLVIAIERIMQ